MSGNPIKETMFGKRVLKKRLFGKKDLYFLLQICLRGVKQMNINTGWRRLIGSLKLPIIFHKRATKYRSLLRRMTCKDKGSYESSPPCMAMSGNPIKETILCKRDLYFLPMSGNPIKETILCKRDLYFLAMSGNPIKETTLCKRDLYFLAMSGN